METFFGPRGYPNDLIRRGRERASTKPRAKMLKSEAANDIVNDRVPSVTTFHPSNLVARKNFSSRIRAKGKNLSCENYFYLQKIKKSFSYQ